MKKFKFRLEGLYRLRKEQERQALFVVQGLRQKEIFLQKEILGTKKERSNWMERYNEVSMHHNPQSELQLIEEYLIALELRERRINSEIEELLKQIDRALADVRSAYMARRQVEYLKGKQEEEFNEDLKRQERRAVDEFNALGFLQQHPANSAERM